MTERRWSPCRRNEVFHSTHAAVTPIDALSARRLPTAVTSVEIDEMRLQPGKADADFGDAVVRAV